LVLLQAGKDERLDRAPQRTVMREDGGGGDDDDVQGIVAAVGLMR
jgi:hypothetical protein